MQITVAGREIELNFGIRFIREIDEKYNVLVKGKKFGTGIEETIPRIMAGDVMALEDVLYASTWMEKKRPTLSQMDDFIDGVEDIDGLFNEVLDELKKQNATKIRASAAVAETMEAAAQVESTLKELEKTEKTLKKNTKK